MSAEAEVKLVLNTIHRDEDMRAEEADLLKQFSTARAKQVHQCHYHQCHHHDY